MTTVRTIEIPAFRDADGMDEFVLSIFNTQNPSESLVDFTGSFADCVFNATFFQALRHLNGEFMQLRIVIERIA